MRFLGHPIHPMLVAFPIALLGLAPVWDVMAVAGVMAGAHTVGYFFLLAGVIGGGLAAIPGFVDLIKIPQDEKAAAKTALIHAGLALTMVSLFGAALAVRGGRAATPTPLVLSLEIAGALLLGATGWFGGHLVFRHAVGVRAHGAGDKD